MGALKKAEEKEERRQAKVKVLQEKEKEKQKRKDKEARRLYEARNSRRLKHYRDLAMKALKRKPRRR